MAIIDTDTNVDLKEGKALYSCPLDTLTCEELAKAYAYALFEWGESIQSRIVLDALRDKEETSRRRRQKEMLFATDI